jgi:nucleotide-binding universal stress UspA family protein
MFPGWSVSLRAAYGSPAFQILSLAEEIEAELIVVGAHGRSLTGSLFFGSVSQKVLTEAKCSVRIARGRLEVNPRAHRSILGYDGTTGADATVYAVSARRWPPDSEVKLVTATDPPVGPDEEINEEQRTWIEKSSKTSVRKLSAAGLSPVLDLKAGDPKHILCRSADDWKADCIFVGANSMAGVGHFLVGSTAAAVASRSNCSVEVVRKSS